MPRNSESYGRITYRQMLAEQNAAADQTVSDPPRPTGSYRELLKERQNDIVSSEGFKAEYRNKQEEEQETTRERLQDAVRETVSERNSERMKEAISLEFDRRTEGVYNGDSQIGHKIIEQAKEKILRDVDLDCWNLENRGEMNFWAQRDEKKKLSNHVEGYAQDIDTAVKLAERMEHFPKFLEMLEEKGPQIAEAHRSRDENKQTGGYFPEALTGRYSPTLMEEMAANIFHRNRDNYEIQGATYIIDKIGQIREEFRTQENNMKRSGTPTPPERVEAHNAIGEHLKQLGAFYE